LIIPLITTSRELGDPLPPLGGEVDGLGLPARRAGVVCPQIVSTDVDGLTCKTPLVVGHQVSQLIG
jgi:hypothetical protein